MANGNGRNLTGSARKHFNQGNISAALAASSEQHTRTQVREIISDPRRLVEQPPTWVLAHQNVQSNIYKMWEHQIRNRASSATIMLRKHLATVPGIEKDQTVALQFTGRGIIYVTHCPLCNKECVILEIIPLAEFKPRTFTDRIFRNRQCDHRLPLPYGFWQFLQNVNSLLGASEPDTGPCN